MKLVIAPDSFKECMSAFTAADAIEAGFRDIFAELDCIKLPLADGGEGTAEILTLANQGEWLASRVDDPLGRQITAHWGWLPSQATAIIEIAAASGLDKLTPTERNPLAASSFGTGQLISEALDKGARRLIIGLGGSATNDGGAGILSALGGQLLDEQGQPLARGGAALAALSRLDLSGLDPRCREVEVILACDVSNPLCGPEGASAVFGPQKGADDAMVMQLDQALAHFAHIIAGQTGAQLADRASFGAAGGAPAGLSLAFELILRPGIEVILETLEAELALQDADLLITGEGRLDNQTLQGKTPFGIATLARKHGVAVIGIAGALGEGHEALYDGPFDALFSLVPGAIPLEQALQHGPQLLRDCARNLAATVALGGRFGS